MLLAFFRFYKIKIKSTEGYYRKPTILRTLAWKKLLVFSSLYKILVTILFAVLAYSVLKLPSFEDLNQPVLKILKFCIVEEISFAQENNYKIEYWFIYYAFL